MATFILVHGTFATSAHWPALQDGLALAARTAGENPVFEQLRWTGKNRAGARQAAATTIFTSVQKIRSTSRNEEIFVIGHSHGGSAIAYFLKEHPELAKTLSGCAFLSTPFVAIRPRSQTNQLVFSVVVYFPALAAAMLWAQFSYGPYVLPSILFYFGFGLSAAAYYLLRFFVRKSHYLQRLLEDAIRRQTADLPSGNYLFLRCSGDEAAAALSAVQFIAWLCVKISKTLKLLYPYSSSHETVKFVSGYLVPFIIVATTVTAPHFALHITLSDIDAFFKHIAQMVSEGRFLTVLLDLFFVGLAIIVPCLFALRLLAAFLIFLTQALISWAFGWTQFSTGFLIELAVEPLPFGAHTLVHIDWSAGSLGAEGIAHSWTYAHPVAIRHVQDWVKAALQYDRT